MEFLSYIYSHHNVWFWEMTFINYLLICYYALGTISSSSAIWTSCKCSSRKKTLNSGGALDTSSCNNVWKHRKELIDRMTDTWISTTAFFLILNVWFMLARIFPPARCNAQSDMKVFSLPSPWTQGFQTRDILTVFHQTMDWILNFSGEKSKKSTPWRQQNSKNSICIVVGISVKVFNSGGQLSCIVSNPFTFILPSVSRVVRHLELNWRILLIYSSWIWIEFELEVANIFSINLEFSRIKMNCNLNKFCTVSFNYKSTFLITNFYSNLFILFYVIGTFVNKKLFSYNITGMYLRSVQFMC